MKNMDLQMMTKWRTLQLAPFLPVLSLVLVNALGLLSPVCYRDILPHRSLWIQ